MVFVHNHLRGNTFFLRLQGDRHAIFIRSANELHVTLIRAQKSRINIRRDVNSRQVANVYRTIGVRQSRRYRISLYFTAIQNYFFNLSKDKGFTND